MNDKTILDVELLQGYLDNLGVAVVEKMQSLYQQQSVVYLAEIEQCIGHADSKAWQESCHKMKGAAGSIGLHLVRSHLAAIEKQLLTPEERANLFNQLTTLNEQGLAEFKEWLMLSVSH